MTPRIQRLASSNQQSMPSPKMLPVKGFLSVAGMMMIMVLPNLAEAAPQKHNHLRHQLHPEKHQPDPRNLNSIISSRIVGGSPVDAADNDYPYFVEWEGAKCGGAVIHDDIVITAAHCYNPNNPPASRRIRLNSVNRGQGGIQMQYLQAIPHPLYDYDSASEDYDVLLLKTFSSTLVFGDGQKTGVEAIAIADAEVVEEGVKKENGVLAVGLGKTSENDNALSPVLRDALLYFIDDEFCGNQYNPGQYNPELMFCTGVPGGGKDTCQGDSGGPMIDHATGQLVGVVSFGEGCAREDYSGVNTRISSMRTWIDQMICDNSSFPPASCPSRTPPISEEASSISQAQATPVPSTSAPVPSTNAPTAAQQTDPTTPGGSSSSASTPGGSSSSSATPPGGSASSAGSKPAPMYNPREQNNERPSPLYNPHSQSTLNALEFPGDGPMVATNAITVNIKYRANSQLVTWTLAKESTELDEGWVPYFRSARGVDGDLQSQTFEDLPPGWWRFQLSDPHAASRMAAQGNRAEAPAIEWMSIMAPRGSNPYARKDGFTNTQYDVYLRINEVGIVSEVAGDTGK